MIIKKNNKIDKKDKLTLWDVLALAVLLVCFIGQYVAFTSLRDSHEGLKRYVYENIPVKSTKTHELTETKEDTLNNIALIQSWF